MTVKKKEEDVKNKEKNMDSREKEMQERERQLTERENKLVERERECVRRERKCEEMYHQYTDKHRKLANGAAAPGGAGAAFGGQADTGVDMMAMDTVEKENAAHAMLGGGGGAAHATTMASKYPPGTMPSAMAGGDRQDIINRIRALRDN